ncbi:unnamed protein product [Agarophyton chilense]
MFPTAPPWYFLKHGVRAANYSMKGDPAVLARVDERLSMNLFHNMYAKGGKVVFGAWPSLHAAWPYLIARFPVGYGRASSRGRVASTLIWMYVGLVWWAAIYLRHHYAADLLGGALFAELSLAASLMVERRVRARKVFGNGEGHLRAQNDDDNADDDDDDDDDDFDEECLVADADGYNERKRWPRSVQLPMMAPC